MTRGRSHLFAVLVALCSAVASPRWSWDRLPDADLDSYRVETAYLDPNYYPCTGTLCGPTCDPAAPGCCVDFASQCVSYVLSAWSLSAEEQQVASTESSVCTAWDAGSAAGQLVPPLGAVLFVNVRGKDAAGNVGQ